MKNTIKHTISFLLVLILLASTLQLSIFKMECLISGKSEISLSDFEDCENDSKDNCSFSETCCCFHQMDLNFDYQTQLSSKSFIQIPTITIFKTVTDLSFEIKNVDFNLFTNLPPPSGYDLIKVVQVFLI